MGALGADFLAFSGHKMLGPTGIGVLWARRELLEAMPPFLGGGEMISDVRLDGFSCAELPWKFEAGTPPIAEAVGLGAAIDYLQGVGMDAVRAHEVALTSYAVATLAERFGDRFRVHGPAEPDQRSGVLSFEFTTARATVHPHDIAQVLDSEGVCVRAGHHCAKPLMRVLGVSATARASFYVYNDEDDVDAPGRRPDRRRQDLWLGERTDGRPRGPVPRDHSRPLPLAPEPRRAAGAPGQKLEGFNPLCGDEIVLYLDVDDSAGTVSDLRIGGQGCSISQASSSMMGAAVRGRRWPRPAG